MRADYNVLFREPRGQISQAQFQASATTWSWADAADIYHLNGSVERMNLKERDKVFATIKATQVSVENK